MKAKHIVIRVILLVLISLLSLALTAVGVFAVLGWNMHSEAIEARPVRQVYADASADEHFVSCDELPEFYVNAVTATRFLGSQRHRPFRDSPGAAPRHRRDGFRGGREHHHHADRKEHLLHAG